MYVSDEILVSYQFPLLKFEGLNYCNTLEKKYDEYTYLPATIVFIKHIELKQLTANKITDQTILLRKGNTINELQNHTKHFFFLITSP